MTGKISHSLLFWKIVDFLLVICQNNRLLFSITGIDIQGFKYISGIFLQSVCMGFSFISVAEILFHCVFSFCKRRIKRHQRHQNTVRSKSKKKFNFQNLKKCNFIITTYLIFPIFVDLSKIKWITSRCYETLRNDQIWKTIEQKCQFCIIIPE